MAICPTCNSQIQIGSEFFGGLFTCPACRAVYFIGFDGTPEKAQPHEPAPVENNPPQVFNSEPLPEIPSQVLKPPMESYSQNDQSGYIPQEALANQIPENPMNLSTGASYDQSFNPGNEGQDINAPIDAYQNYQTPQEVTPVFSPLQDVVDFANSESSPSLILYSLELSGLESLQQIQALRDVLTDSKLQLSFDDLKSKIKNGNVRLERLNPAQAAIIAFRLRPLSLDMKWEQTLA